MKTITTKKKALSYLSRLVKKHKTITIHLHNQDSTFSSLNPVFKYRKLTTKTCRYSFHPDTVKTISCFASKDLTTTIKAMFRYDGPSRRYSIFVKENEITRLDFK